MAGRGSSKGAGKGPVQPGEPPPAWLRQASVYQGGTGDYRSANPEDIPNYSQVDYPSGEERRRGQRPIFVPAHQRTIREGTVTLQPAASQPPPQEQVTGEPVTPPVHPPWWENRPDPDPRLWPGGRETSAEAWGETWENRRQSWRPSQPWGTTEWPASSERQRNTQGGRHEVSAREFYDRRAAAEAARAAERPAPSRPMTRREFSEAREELYAMDTAESSSDSLEYIHLGIAMRRQEDEVSRGERRAQVPHLSVASFNETQTLVYELLRQPIVTHRTYTYTLFKKQRCVMCHEVKLINTTIQEDDGEVERWPDNAVRNCCVTCVSTDLRLRQNPYTSITQHQAFHLLKDALKHDRRERITIDDAKDFIRELAINGRWTWDLHTPDWIVFVNFAKGLYDESDQSGDEPEPFNRERYFRRASVVESRLYGDAQQSARAARDRARRRAEGGSSTQRYVEDSDRSNRRRLNNPPQRAGRENVRNRVQEAVQAARGQGSRLPEWANDVLNHLDNPQPDVYVPFSGRGYRMAASEAGGSPPRMQVSAAPRTRR